ncbi:hypothetical protein H311_01685 [Anncaliia algerae PRA109]|nr:hypothetical protein H311_01685 [Anncaliia algerae PRA109]
MRLRGQAQAWATRLRQASPNISLYPFKQQLKERLSNTEKIHRILEEFIKKNGHNEEEILEMLKKGKFYVELNFINIISCIKLIIARVHLVLKPILHQIASVHHNGNPL